MAWQELKCEPVTTVPKSQIVLPVDKKSTNALYKLITVINNPLAVPSEYLFRFNGDTDPNHYGSVIHYFYTGNHNKSDNTNARLSLLNPGEWIFATSFIKVVPQANRIAINTILNKFKGNLVGNHTVMYYDLPVDTDLDEICIDSEVPNAIGPGSEFSLYRMKQKCGGGD